MYVNGKMILVKTIPGIGGGRKKENNGGSEFKYDIFDIRTFTTAIMYTHQAQQIIVKKKAEIVLFHWR
jgi:hypothetical protein